MPGYSVFKPDFNTGGTAAAAGIGSIAGLPWNIVLPIALSFITSFFGDDEDYYGEASKMKSALDRLGLQEPYKSPFLPGLDKVTLQAILNQMKRSGNWGWPGGKQMDMSFIMDFLDEVSRGGIQQQRTPIPYPISLRRRRGGL